ncbi:MAG TPA: hypothetical protein VHZ51_25690 [Ktedonobacteraceae bacterium]|nr:hypothetical protein [Ktedonobacteraceae bacterium]
MQKSDRYCGAALILLTLGIFFLSVMVFSFNPQSPLGILSACIGVLLTLGSILCFVLYNRALKQEAQQEKSNT